MGRARTPLARGRKFSALRDELAIRRKELKARTVGKPPQDPKFSIVSAVYNVEKYLDDYFTSIVLQPEFLGQIQVIVVNDGSTDRSLDILNAWRRRFPHNITVVSKENGGQASARNLGMTYATGEWITFIDPDDFVSSDYFDRIGRFHNMHREHNGRLAIICSNLKFFHEATGAIKDDHPLRYRFAGEAIVSVSDPGRQIQMSAATALFRREVITNLNLKFDERIKPAFEDANLVARFLLHQRDAAIGFCEQAIYYYRKREDASSTLDISRSDPRRYDDQLRFGHLPLISSALNLWGHVPVWLQRMMLYDVIWQIKALTDQDHKLSFLTPTQVECYYELLRQVFNYIDLATIEEFELAGTSNIHRAGIAKSFKQTAISVKTVVAEDFDLQAGTLVLRWTSSSPHDALTVDCDDRAILELERMHQLHTFLRRPFAYTHRRRYAAKSGVIRVRLNGVLQLLWVDGIRPIRSLNLNSVATAIGRRVTSVRTRTPRIDRIRTLASASEARSRYGGCWVLMDRDTQADDNAEHLYRYLRQERPDINAYFLLRRSSSDWARLSREGFKLIDFADQEADIALLNAKYFASSHIDRYVSERVSSRDYGDMRNYKFIFLQHGITKDDLSHWLNTKQISLFITATWAEHASIAGEGSRYKFLPSEVSLTGFPRHDRLLMKSRSSKRTILVMPTWRESIVGRGADGTAARLLSTQFMETAYARAWHSFLNSARLRDILKSYSYSVVFCAHPNIQPYLSQFSMPRDFSVHTPLDNSSLQDLFAMAAVLVTDYSSVAFELAYLCRPVVYYQFDREEVFSGAHTTRVGYFDYERDGFGPVCISEADVLSALENLLSNNGTIPEKYAVRALSTFSQRDGRCCERVVSAIEALGTLTQGPNACHSESADCQNTSHNRCPARSWRGAWHSDRRESCEIAASFTATETGY